MVSGTIPDGDIYRIENALASAIKYYLLNVDVHIYDHAVLADSSIVVSYKANTTSCSSGTLINYINRVVFYGFLTSELYYGGLVDASAKILPSLVAESTKPTSSPTSSSPTFFSTSSPTLSPTSPTLSPTLSPTAKYRQYPKSPRAAAPFCLVKVNDQFAYPFFHHYGSIDYTGDKYKPSKCNCNDGTGYKSP